MLRDRNLMRDCPPKRMRTTDHFNEAIFIKGLMLVTALCISGSALAGEACDRPKNDFDGRYCLPKIYQEADKELNSNYKPSSRSCIKVAKLSWSAASFFGNSHPTPNARATTAKAFSLTLNAPPAPPFPAHSFSRIVSGSVKALAVSIAGCDL